MIRHQYASHLPREGEALEPASSMVKIALLPWGNVIEDYLDDIGINLEAFCAEMTGGWLFGYVEALKRHNIETVIACYSGKAREIASYSHLPTGAEILVLPSSRRYLRWKSKVLDPYGSSVEQVYGRSTMFKLPLRAVERHAIHYFATPLHSLISELRFRNCRAILCQEYESPRFDLAVLAGFRLKVPVVGCFQGGDFQLSKIEPILRHFTLRKCDGVIIGPASEAARVERKYGLAAEKIARVFNPINLKLWFREQDPQLRRKLDLPLKATIVTWHGRIDIRRKGLDILLDAWNEIESNYTESDPYLLLVGTGANADELAKRLMLLNSKRVIWRNQYLLDRGHMRSILSASDLYVLPSRHEGMAVAPMEAMACGLPIVATDAPGVADILPEAEKSGGIMVPRENSGALASALIRLINNPTLREDLGNRARETAERLFSIEAVGRNLNDLFRNRLKLPQ